jgi:hypothetical protein
MILTSRQDQLNTLWNPGNPQGRCQGRTKLLGTGLSDLLVIERVVGASSTERLGVKRCRAPMNVIRHAPALARVCCETSSKAAHDYENAIGKAGIGE